MADENSGNVEAAEATATPPTPDTAPLIDNEGNLREGWTSILDEDLRDEPYLKEAKTLQGISRSVVSARGMVGKDKIVKPTEASSQADWDDWYTAGGKPQTADYGFVRPEELPEEYYSQERADKYTNLFHKIGLNRTQAEALFNEHNADVIAELKKSAQDAELSMTELTDGLHADWGNAFEQKKHLGNKAVEEGTDGDEEFKARFLEKYGNDPDVIRIMANLGSKFAEAGTVTADLIPTPGDIQEQIDAAQGNPAYGAEFAKHGFTKAQHRQQVQLVQRLFNQKMTSERRTG